MRISIVSHRELGGKNFHHFFCFSTIGYYESIHVLGISDLELGVPCSLVYLEAFGMITVVRRNRTRKIVSFVYSHDAKSVSTTGYLQGLLLFRKYDDYKR